MLGAIFSLRPVSAGEVGHYSPGLSPILTPSLPPPGLYYVESIYNYHISKKGRGATTLTIPGVSPPKGLDLSLEVDVNYDLVSADQTVYWVTGKKFLFADYAVTLTAPVTYADTDIKGSFTLQRRGGEPILRLERELHENQFNLGDLFVGPVNLGWQWPRFDLMANYGFYAPTGKYKNGEIDNIGLGFFTHQFQLGGIYYLVKDRSLGLSVLGTYEMHQEKIDTDIKPGNNVTLGWGISKTFKHVFEIGLKGYSMWQVERDSGSDLSFKSDKYQLHGIGGEISYTIPKWRLNVSLCHVRDFDSKARPEAEFTALTFTYQLR